LGKADDTLTKLNIQIKTRFQSFLSVGKHKEQSKQVHDSDEETIHGQTEQVSGNSDEPVKKTTQSFGLRCRYCDRRFRDGSAFETHVKEEHGDYL